MTCPRCHTEIAEGALVCPVCGDWYAASAQKERVDALKSKAKTIVHDSFHSGMFLAMTVLMTVTAAANLFSIFTVTANNEIFSFNFNYIAILYVIAAIFCWKAYTSTNPLLAGDHIGRVSIIETTYWIVLLIATCLLGLGALCCFAFIGISGELLGATLAELEPSLKEAFPDQDIAYVTDLIASKSGLIFAAVGIVLLIVGAFILWGAILHRKRRLYLKSVQDSINEYNIIKPAPYISVIVYAALNLAGGAGSFSSAEILISTIGALAFNSYIIVSAVWMAKLHRDELANNAEIENESAVLNNLIYASKIEFEKKPNKAEENQ
jgi:hypothetical protein